MNDLPEALFLNPVWHALQTKHRQLAMSAGNASRYPADVCPFASVAEPGRTSLQHLHSLLAPGEYIWLVGETDANVSGLTLEENLACLQMVLPEEVTPPEPRAEIVSLTGENAAEMVALTDIAFPGFFRKRTCEMGSYYGLRSGGELIAMGGERLRLDGYSEISGICTHPAHRGKGLAADLIWRVAQDHRRQGIVPWLHVSSGNRRAIELYLRLGFKTVREVILSRISRAA
jgi:ribosomal protein S18 acetylase RimI-like enzyme